MVNSGHLESILEHPGRRHFFANTVGQTMGIDLTLCLRKLCKNDFQRCRQQIGDEGDLLESDESQFGKGKYAAA